jgi:chemotaxis protein CheD
MRDVYLQPGDVRWSAEPCRFRTVLGSCVAVCLWDRANGIGGLNHFMLPRGGAGGTDPRFGDVAIPRLIGGLGALGCTGLVAKVFGGAAVAPIGGMGTVGDANTAFALESLSARGIPVVARRTGGAKGVVIRYLSGTGEVMLREIHDLSTGMAVAPPPRRAWAA